MLKGRAQQCSQALWSFYNIYPSANSSGFIHGVHSLTSTVQAAGRVQLRFLTIKTELIYFFLGGNEDNRG